MIGRAIISPGRIDFGLGVVRNKKERVCRGAEDGEKTSRGQGVNAWYTRIGMSIGGSYIVKGCARVFIIILLCNVYT